MRDKSIEVPRPRRLIERFSAVLDRIFFGIGQWVHEAERFLAGMGRNFHKTGRTPAGIGRPAKQTGRFSAGTGRLHP